MFWSRTGNLWDLIFWVLLSLIWWGGGWLISAHLFRLPRRERLFSGLAIGLLLFILFANLAAYILSMPLAFAAAGLSVAALGVIAARSSGRQPWFDVNDLRIPGQMLGFCALLILFGLINRGLAIFDDFLNIPLTSWLASDHFPPYYYLNPARLMDYHYGLHLFAASLVRLAGFYPWDAFDFAKSLTLALAILLAGLWLRRFERQKHRLLLLLLVFVFAGGSRWLLLLVPEKQMEVWSQGIELLGSARLAGPDLASALVGVWEIEGEGPFPFPFAFASGIFRPLTFALGSAGGIPALALSLLLLLSGEHRRRVNRSEWLRRLVVGLLLASLALIAEHLFVMLWIGLFLAMLAASSSALATKASAAAAGTQQQAAPPSPSRLGQRLSDLAWLLAPGAVLAPWMGGVITGIVLRWLGLSTAAETAENLSLPEMSLLWPPRVLSAHLGSLAPGNPHQLLIALAEIGPVLLAAPILLALLPNQLRQRRWAMAGMNLGAVLGFLSSLMIDFSARERDLTRLMDSALSIWLLLALTYLAAHWQRFSPARKAFITFFAVISVTAGLALFPAELIAISQPQRTHFIFNLDTQISQRYWNTLEADARVLDLGYPYRPAVVLGRGTNAAYLDAYRRLPEFVALLNQPLPARAAAQGYDYIYLDKESWIRFSPELQRAYFQPCVKTVVQLGATAVEGQTIENPPDEFRWLVDIRLCR